MEKLFLISIFIILSACNYAYAQTTEPPTVTIQQSTADVCAQPFELGKAKDAAITALQTELVTSKDLLTKETAYNDELLKSVALLVSSEKRNKSFFEKLRAQLGKTLSAATEPKTITTIVSVILILDRLSK